MIFDLTQSYVPESYRESRDYRVFLRQLSTLLSVLKYNIDHFPDLYSADECPDHLLPLLSTMVGYKYKEEKSLVSNRKIIRSFPYLLRNRGSELGIKLAVALSINTDQSVTRVYSIDTIVVSPDVEKGVLRIYYPRIDVIDWELIEYVRPVGMRIELIQSDIATVSEELDLENKVKATLRHKYFDESIVDKSIVGFDVNSSEEGDHE